MAVQFCGTCGHPLIPDQLFCQHCGSRVDENATRAAPPAPAASSVSPGGTLYCGECGALVGSQDRVCRRCGAPVEPISGGVSDPSLSDVPTMMGTPPPPAYQPSPGGPQPPAPGSTPQQPQGWGASYNPGLYNESPTFTISGPRAGVQAPPYQPAGPGVPPRQRQRWPLVLALVLVALILIAGGGAVLAFHPFGGNPQTNNPTPTTAPGVTQTPGVTVTPSPTAVVLNPQTASALVQQYFAYINAKNYDAAYDLLSPEWQQTQSRQNFKDGFQNTIQDTLTIDNATQLANGTVEVDIHLTAQETGGTKNFSGYYIVTKENGKLLLLRAKINQV